MIRKILTIAGSDSGGGSGIQADIKTILSLGGYGMSVVTALTAQNTLGVQSVIPVDPAFVALQMDSVLSDIGADCVKIGMLAKAQIAEAVADGIAKYGIQKVVVDPVMAATNGTPLLDEDGRNALIKRVFPLTYLLTPNIHEAEILTGSKITGVPEMKKAAKKIQKMGPKFVKSRHSYVRQRRQCERWRKRVTRSSRVAQSAQEHHRCSRPVR